MNTSKNTQMKHIIFVSILGFFMLISSCKTTSPNNPQLRSSPFPSRPRNMMCSIEIAERKVTPTDNDICSFKGSILDENENPLSKISVFIDSSKISAKTNASGKYSFDELSPGNHVFRFEGVGADYCFFSVNFSPGDQIEIDAIVHIHQAIEAEKPIIYLYPEDTIDVNIDLIYDGKITTTYPKLTSEGWNVKAFPNGTLIDNNNKEYYALYWEGEPTKPLQIPHGFFVQRDQTISFLEEKLALLGLNAKETNEFIIFWLPILEKNEFNAIHFAAEEYLEQAQLNIYPSPDTEIRIHMVFQGFDERIDLPLQDLSHLYKIREGFTVVEWGGQELPKSYPTGI